MKTKISKKVISICLCLLICISTLPLSMLSVSAVSFNINIRNIVYPRPDAVPQGNVTADGNLSYESVGWVWMNSSQSQVAIGPESFKTFYSAIMKASGEEFYELDKFKDTEKYSLILMFVIKNISIPNGAECTASFYDTSGNMLDIDEDADGVFMPVTTLKSQMPSDISLPDGVTDSDTLLMCASNDMICSPTDHIHTQGDYNSDENRHWRECSVCGKKMAGTESKHYAYASRTENWTEVKKATVTQEGRYERRCTSCSYALDSVTVPKTGEQTIVTSYDELRDALAKGGKQWIKLDFPGKTFTQEDFKYDYTLCLDDPDADITIDLNNCGLRRTSLYDKYLFEVKQGSLRFWQENGNNILDNGYNTHNNLSLEGNKCKAVFNVEAAGSLRLTNVHSLSPGSDDIGTFTYAFPIIKSYGNLRIDSGLYCSYVDTPAVDVCSGNVVINGGEFYSHASGTALKITGTYSNKTYAEINYGKFGSYDTAVSIYKNTVATINGGEFTYKDTDRNLYQKNALYAYGADLTINDGSFYGSEYALYAYCLNSLKIADGYFKLFDETPDSNKSVLYLNGDHNSAATISGGRFLGKTGIYSNCKVNLSKIIPSVCNAYDENGKIDTTATAKSIGTGYTIVEAPRTVITTQPSGGHSSVMGDAIVLKIDAENANEYIWHIIDEDGHELSWDYLSDNGYADPYIASGGKMLMLREVSDWMTGKRVYCEVKGYGGTVMSDIVELSVDKVIKYCNDIYFDDFDQIWNHKTVGDFKNPKTGTDAPYTIGNVRWSMFRKILGDDFEFDNGDNVTVAIDVIPKEGYTFYSSVFGKLNGIDSYATIKNDDGSRSIVFTMTITAPEEYKTKNIELSVKAPVAGQTPATTAKCTSGYAVPGTPEWTPGDAKFKTNTEYTVKIPVTAEYVMGDIDTVTAKVNGKDAEFVAERKSGKIYAYYVVYTFEATGATEEPDFVLGDVNLNGKITIDDATLIQKYLAGMEDFDDTVQLLAADVDGKGNITIDDATIIQKYLAGLATIQ